jgi:hypothetical protein
MCGCGVWPRAQSLEVLCWLWPVAALTCLGQYRTKGKAEEEESKGGKLREAGPRTVGLIGDGLSFCVCGLDR